MKKIGQQFSEPLALFPIVLVLLFFISLYLIPLGISAVKILVNVETEIRATGDVSKQFEP